MVEAVYDDLQLDLTDTIRRVLERAPAWIRSELTANDPATRSRAEEALAAMIAAALRETELAGG